MDNQPAEPMREVRYVRSDAWVRVALCGLLTLGGLVLAWVSATPWLGLGVTFGGAVATQVARLPLLEPDALLRLTPQGVWTKELGWRAWNEVVVTLERNDRSRGWNAHVLHIHLPAEFIPRFIEGVGMLDISEVELRHWLNRYARPA